MSSFPWIVTLNSYVMTNECSFSLFKLSSVFKASADTLPGGAKQWKFSVAVNFETFETEMANFENDIAVRDTEDNSIIILIERLSLP